MNDKSIIVLGAGGHARVLLDMLLSQGCKVIGLTDEDASLWGQSVFGVPVLGDDRCIQRYLRRDIMLVNGIGSVDSMQLHRQVYEAMKRQGYSFAQVVSSATVISDRVVLDEGVLVMPGVVVNEGTSIGANTILNTRSVLDHECRIGKHVHIAPGCVLSGNVVVGDNVHIGTGSTVIQGIHIGEGTLVGAGSVVVKDIAGQSKAYGVPARVVGRL